MKNKYFKPILFLCILIAVVVWASYTGGPFPYMCLFSLLFYCPFSFFYILISNYYLQNYQELPSRRIMKNEEQPYRLTLENGGFIRINDSSPILESDFSKLTFDAKNDDFSAINLAPSERHVITGTLTCRYAGTYDIGLKEVSYCDPFGIISIPMQIPEPFRVTVMPMITDIADNILNFENLKNSSRLKSYVLKEPIPGNELRPYIIGDSMKSIHWKASASCGELITRTPEVMDLKIVSLILIAEKAEFGKNDPEFIKKRDYFLEFAVSAAYYYAKKGESIRIIYPRGEIKDKQIATLDSFSEFYEDISRGPFYNGDDDYLKLMGMCESMAENERDSIIITVRESEYEKETFLDVRIGG